MLDVLRASEEPTDYFEGGVAMDFSTTELFVEIFIVGALLLFGISPIIIRFFSSVDEQKSILPRIGRWGDLNPAGVVLAVALMYSLGIAGNRLIECLYDLGCVKPNVTSDSMELAVRDHSEVARDWVERHKTYHKVLRAASFSCFLFLISMGVYRAFGQREAHPRYDRRHYLVAIVLGAFFLSALAAETLHYKKRLQVYCTIVQESDTQCPPLP
jgi:hypothetical protein